MDNFEVAVPRDEMNKMEESSIPDYNRSKDGTNVYKCQKLVGGWMTCIRKAINEYEKNEFSIIGQNGRMNLQKKTDRANYFTATGKLNRIFFYNF